MSKDEMQIKTEKVEFGALEVQNSSNSIKESTRSTAGNCFDAQVCDVKIEENNFRYDENVSKIDIKPTPYFCAACSIDFEEKNAFFVHLLTYHDGKKPFKCLLCEYPLSKKSALNKHIRIIHGANKEGDNSVAEFDNFDGKIENCNDVSHAEFFVEKIEEQEGYDEGYIPEPLHEVDYLCQNTAPDEEIKSNEIEGKLLNLL
jgi:hypothetical protein